MFRALGFAAVLFAATAVQTPAGAQDGHGAHPEVGHGHHHAEFASDRIHVRVDGDMDGRDIILIPGLSSSPEIWQGTVDHLTAQDGVGWRVHRIHVQGFAGAPAEGNAQGATPTPVAAPVAEEIARYIREQELIKPAVVGHSMGGTIGLMLAVRHPDSVGKLMVVDMIPFMGAMFGPPGTTAEAVTPVADQIWAAQAGSPREAYVAQATTAITGMINTESRREAALEDMRASDQKVSAAAFRELVTTDLRPELTRITAPTEVLYVKFNDPRMTPQITDAIYQMSFANLPGVTLKRIDDSAHFIMLDQPQAFYGELDAFLSAK
ncbi:alpha/beta hydrolase [Brevundimonas sp. EAKA]|jgi:pimeloyl-ACP methyl ester carboxylesterase|uniref:Aminoacrylate hydrolase RutD n=1 Tax=Brevundimonas mediterranea TaxID=74329 RepID=A0A7Z8Y3E0_9CAUL|nr:MULTISPECIES: alpha/beta hydrolase [Brevundimonas]MBU4197891.1 alpha/beta hydrolase [Alphaproteobacteria bacterium]OGN45648.1 MAG: alpha/beta hydrolase [Caulobacterales bacterium GWE1_67_11]KDP95034.1 alpha/beta hydrolase [Brevundimonas sp. EAKA]MCG2664668.1 alpha/beta hydrolase [Brevundimonas sp.]VDC50169.1 Putative aminoacrylate hydrolase RutD [Brevundimonas mediterranea]